MPDLPLLPDPTDPRLTRRISGTDQTGAPTEIAVVEERPLTIYLNRQEIVTAMTIGDHPEYLALGFLRNQGMLRPDDVVTGVLPERGTHAPADATGCARDQSAHPSCG